MLLLPLGIDPVWVADSELREGDLYYGPQDLSLGKGVLSLSFSQQAEAYFAAGTPYRSGDSCMRTWDGESWPVLFAGEEPGSDDLVASTFFWLSGWQEHVVPFRDIHARFPHGESLQRTLGVTARPVVDAYRSRLASELRRHGVVTNPRKWGGATWALCPTIDVDYLVKWRKGMIYREVVEYLVRNLRSEHLSARVRRFGQFLRDAVRPGDVYQSALTRIHQTIKHHGTGTFFFKAAAHGPRDVHYSLQHPFLRKFVATLVDDGFELGVHPSYHAHTHIEYMLAEREAVATLAGHPPLSVRQHFLRYEAPVTPRLQERVGYRIDSTLGFAEHEGFRNGTCMPFLRFDTSANTVTRVWEMPLAVMESALFNRLGLDLAAAKQATHDILAQCRRFGGAAVMLWHSVLWDEMDHPGWGEHFLDTLACAADQKAQVASLQEALSAWLGGTVAAT